MDFYTAYFYYAADLTQTLSALAALTQLVETHGFSPPAYSQDPMVALPFGPSDLNPQSARTAMSPSGPPDQPRLPNLPLQAIFEQTHQVL